MPAETISDGTLPQLSTTGERKGGGGGIVPSRISLYKSLQKANVAVRQGGASSLKKPPPSLKRRLAVHLHPPKLMKKNNPFPRKSGKKNVRILRKKPVGNQEHVYLQVAQSRSKVQSQMAQVALQESIERVKAFIPLELMFEYGKSEFASEEQRKKAMLVEKTVMRLYNGKILVYFEHWMVIVYIF